MTKQIQRRVSLRSEIIYIFEEKIGYRIPNAELLINLLNVPLRKYIFEFNRLEFYGDSLLSYTITKALLATYHNKKIGDISTYRSYLVSKAFICYKIMPILDIVPLMNFHEAALHQEKNISNIFEIIIGLISLYYTEQDAISFIKELYAPFLHDLRGKTNVKKYKTLLQELAQLDSESTISYTNLPRTEQDDRYVVELKVKCYKTNLEITTSSAKSYKDAQELAAYMIYNKLKVSYTVLS